MGAAWSNSARGGSIDDREIDVQIYNDLLEHASAVSAQRTAQWFQKMGRTQRYHVALDSIRSQPELWMPDNKDPKDELVQREILDAMIEVGISGIMEHI